MNDKTESAKNAEILALKEETHKKRIEIYESYGMTYPPKWNGGRDTTFTPPEIKELERQMFVKYKAIQEKYKE